MISTRGWFLGLVASVCGGIVLNVYALLGDVILARYGGVIDMGFFAKLLACLSILWVFAGIICLTVLHRRFDATADSRGIEKTGDAAPGFWGIGVSVVGFVGFNTVVFYPLLMEGKTAFNPPAALLVVLFALLGMAVFGMTVVVFRWTAGTVRS